jgi:hypothetical protein
MGGIDQRLLDLISVFEPQSGSEYVLITFQRAKPRDPADEERELTQLVMDLHAAIVKSDIAFLERVLH